MTREELDREREASRERQRKRFVAEEPYRRHPPPTRYLSRKEIRRLREDEYMPPIDVREKRW